MAVDPRAWLLAAVAAYLRRTSIEKARWRLELFAIREARDIGARLGTRRVRTRHGFRMELELNDWVDQHIYATGDYEPYSAHVMQALLRPGDCMLDVGANVGFFSLLAAKCVGAGGRVIAFEPAPETRARLQRNVALNLATSVASDTDWPIEVRAEAITDQWGDREFFTGPRQHSGIASLRSLGADADQAIQVPGTTLDRALPDGTPVHLVKIDIEGAEAEALRGMERILQECHPHLLLEVSADYLCEMGDSAAGLFAFLEDFGYQAYRIEWDHLVPLAGWSESLPRQFNALFTTSAVLPAGLRVAAATEPGQQELAEVGA
jgi:FkbM family methyltransferase